MSVFQGGGLSRIAWGFLRPIGGDGECNVGVRKGGGGRSSCDGPVAEKEGHEEGGGEGDRVGSFR